MSLKILFIVIMLALPIFGFNLAHISITHSLFPYDDMILIVTLFGTIIMLLSSYFMFFLIFLTCYIIDLIFKTTRLEDQFYQAHDWHMYYISVPRFNKKIFNLRDKQDILDDRRDEQYAIKNRFILSNAAFILYNFIGFFIGFYIAYNFVIAYIPDMPSIWMTYVIDGTIGAYLFILFNEIIFYLLLWIIYILTDSELKITKE